MERYMSIYRNRFERNTRISPARLPVLLSVAAFACLFFLFLNGIRSVSATTLEKEQQSLENALQRSITQCYAVEGTYPPSLSYLEEHYGLTYNKDRFFVDYQPIGSNIMPDVTVLSRTGGTR